jgi:mitochondrial chaperone BCS1
MGWPHPIPLYQLFPEIEALLQEVNDAAPAEVAEKILGTDDTDAVVEAVVKLLRDRKAGPHGGWWVCW